MTDPDLLTAVEGALPGLTHFDRAVYALGRGRLMRGELLKDSQRAYLRSVLARLQPTPDMPRKPPSSHEVASTPHWVTHGTPPPPMTVTEPFNAKGTL